MKKILFILAAVATLTMASCCNNKTKTCDKANTECTVAAPCCKSACEMADSCKKDCTNCEKADSCQKVCPKKATCEKACKKACDKH